MKKQMLVAVVCATVALCSIPAARAADADVTGLEPTIWWDFETQPAADGLTAANKGSAPISFTSEGTKTYSAGVIGGTYAIDTSKYTPYSGSGSFSTAGNPFTLSLVMTLGTKANGITLNVQTSDRKSTRPNVHRRPDHPPRRGRRVARRWLGREKGCLVPVPQRDIRGRRCRLAPRLHRLHADGHEALRGR